VQNLTAWDRPIGWTQHVTLGPPFLERGVTQFRASATRSKVLESRERGPPAGFGIQDRLRVELQNQSSHDIGVDLSEKWMVVYPNQWGGSDLNHRTIIRERSPFQKKLDAQLRARLMDAFRSKRMTMLPPGKSVYYYTNFNASGRKEIEAAEGKFILISIKGQLCFTDGADVWDDQPGFDRDLVIQKPVTWATVPENAMVIER